MPQHVLRTIKPKDKNFNAADAVSEVYDWIRNDFATKNCRRPSGSNQNFTNCSCLHFLADENNSRQGMYLAEYLVRYAGMTRDVKRDLLYEWAKVASVLLSIDPENKLPYMLPGIPANGDDPQQMICRNALLGLLNEGMKSWKTAMKGPTFIHGSTGKKGIDSGRGKPNIEVNASLNLFFNELK